MNPIHGKRILLGVTGSIACYKAADLASKLRQEGAEVDVILTQGALQFVTPLTFQSVTGRRAYTDADMWGDAGHVLHIGLAEQADLTLIAPATANTLAKLAHGIADNLLTVATLAARSPVVVAPAMDGGMFSHPATQANLEILQGRGVQVIGPAAGHLASGQKGVGRMVEPLEIVAKLRLWLARDRKLSGRHIVVTAGGTQEPIDPVRVIANRSSGKQGFALAQAALDLGAQVTLITGPVSLPTPEGARRVDVQTAQEMQEAVVAAVEDADALVMAAAVADFRVAHPSKEKIKKDQGAPELKLVKNPDILKELVKHPSGSSRLKVRVGFAAESRDLLANAQAKLVNKRLDMIVANDITASDAGFGVETNRVSLVYAGGAAETLPLLEKAAVAAIIMEKVSNLLATFGERA